MYISSDSSIHPNGDIFRELHKSPKSGFLVF